MVLTSVQMIGQIGKAKIWSIRGQLMTAAAPGEYLDTVNNVFTSGHIIAWVSCQLDFSAGVIFHNVIDVQNAGVTSVWTYGQIGDGYLFGVYQISAAATNIPYSVIALVEGG